MEYSVKTIETRLLSPNRGQLNGVPGNPRKISDADMVKLRKSLREFPEMLRLRELVVVENGDRFVVVGGNQRLAAAMAEGFREMPCKVLPPETPAEVIRNFLIKDNQQRGVDDWAALKSEWDVEELAGWDMELPDFGKKFEDGMGNAKNQEITAEYAAFENKFELKKTSDDCYTPAVVYDAVADWVAVEYGVSRELFVRPFFPGGDYQREDYLEGCVVVDNPPFSILSEIVKFYNERGVSYFLFSPHLTLFSSESESATCLGVGVSITYENGAVVNTSFITNLNDRSVRFKSSPSLYRAVEAANKANMKEKTVELPKYVYPDELVCAKELGRFSKYGVEFSVSVDESERVCQLDCQKESGKTIFGSGYLVSERAAAERAVAERAAAERAVAERAAAERAVAMKWTLSEREIGIVNELSKK